MKNKGFTLIELLGIVIVLAAIFLVSFPALMNLIKVDDDKKYENFTNNLCEAGKSYIYNNIEEYSELSIVGSEITIGVDELITYGSIKPDLVNPSTNDSVEDDNVVFTVLEDKSLECEYVDN